MREKDLQSLLEIHPYLIERQFLGKLIESQKLLNSGKADMVVHLDDEIVVVELKINALTERDVLQLNGYLQDVQKQMIHKLVRGILIGDKPKNDIDKLVNLLCLPIEVKILKQDISIAIKICKDCRLANDIQNCSCVYCGAISWL